MKVYGPWLFCTSERSCENARMYDIVEKSMESELWQVYKTIRSYQNMPKRPTLKPGQKRPSRNYPQPEKYVKWMCFIRFPASRQWLVYRSLVIVTTSCNRSHSGFFDLKHCYRRASADNISRNFGPRGFKIDQTWRFSWLLLSNIWIYM